jgi:hypothetical protein
MTRIIDLHYIYFLTTWPNLSRYFHKDNTENNLLDKDRAECLISRVDKPF